MSAPASSAGHFAHQHRAGAEGSMTRPSRASSAARVDQRARRAPASSSTTTGDEQDLPLRRRSVALPLHPLVDDALMRGVLVDDDDAVAGLRDDVGVVQLRARRAQRRGGSALAGGRPARARGGRRKTGEARLAPARRSRSGGAAGEARQSQAAAARPARRHAGARNAASVAAPPVVAARCERRLQRLADGADDEAAHQAAVAKAHFGFRRMHVDVDLARVAVEEQRDDRRAARAAR